MRPLNPTAAWAYRRAIEKAGERVQVIRLTGAAPNVVSFTADVVAIVRDYTADSAAASRQGYGASSVGAITQGQRQVIVSAEDLLAKRFPLPLRKNDKILLLSNGVKLNITQVDAEKRAMAGAIELMTADVA